MSKIALLLILSQSAACIKFHIMTSLRSDCPGELAGDPCLTLQQYVSYPSHSSNITLEFEWGNHSLKSSFITSNRAYFGLVATTNATINCDGLSSTYIRFSSTTNVDIKGISFIRCGSIDFRYVTNGTIAVSNFQMSTGTRALYLYYSSYVSIANSKFTDNHGGLTNYNGYGSAIYLNRGSSLIIIQTNFSNNSAYYGGGAIYFVASRSTFFMTERCSFFNNRAVYGNGGAVYISSSYSSTIITSNGNLYENNSAYNNGGVFYISHASMSTTITDSSFTNNQAINSHGGVLFVSGSRSIGISGNIFTNNTARHDGGAAYLSGITSAINMGNRFVNNTATDDGGAIYVSSSSTTNNGNTFINNRAIDDGGAIYVSSSSTTNNRNTFINNKAIDGGALYITSSSSTNSDNTFINNTAIDAGGAIFASGSITEMGNTFSSNRANSNGGALYVSGSSIVTDGSSYINNRVRNGGGGALYTPLNSRVTVTTSDSRFINNVGYTSGGALSVLGTWAVLHINGSIFVNNLITGPDGNGGAVYVAQANVQSISVNNSIFINNSATNGTGGAIYTKQGFSITNTIFGYNRAPLCAAVSIEQSNYVRSMTFMGSTFLHNTAVGPTVRGNIGGVGCIRNADISIFSCTFSHNVATGGGGVFDIEDSTITIESSTFKNNTAGVDGGVFYTHAFPSSYTINESIFMNNRAGDDGGVVYLGRSGGLIQAYGSSFTANTAGDRGGVMAIFGSTVNISDVNMQNNMARSGDDISACNSDNMNDIPNNLNERIDPQHAVCTLYDGSVQAIPEPFLRDNSNLDISVYFQTFITVQDEQIVPVMALQTDPSTTTGPEVDPILKEIQSRLLGTSVVIYLLFSFFIVFVVVLIVMMVVKCKVKNGTQQQSTVNHIMDAHTTTPEQYTESIELYEEPEWCVQGKSNTMPFKPNAGYINQRTQHYVK